MLRVSRRVAIGLAASTAIVLSLSACSGSSESSSSTAGAASSSTSTGKNVTTSGPVDVSPFDGVSVDTGITVDLTVTEGATQSVDVQVPSNYNGKLDLSVSGSTLNITQAGSGVINGRATVKITIPTVTSVSAEEGSQVTGRGETDSYQANASEGSQLNLGDLKAKTVQVSLNEGSQATIYASESITGSANEGSQLTITGSPATQNVSSEEGSSVRSQ